MWEEVFQIKLFCDRHQSYYSDLCLSSPCEYSIWILAKLQLLTKTKQKNECSGALGNLRESATIRHLKTAVLRPGVRRRPGVPGGGMRRVSSSSLEEATLSTRTCSSPGCFQQCSNRPNLHHQSLPAVNHSERAGDRSLPKENQSCYLKVSPCQKRNQSRRAEY